MSATGIGAVGDSARVRRRFSRQDLRDYADLCGQAGTGDTVPEPLIGALFSYLLGVELPGTGTMYLKQETRWLASAQAGETLCAEVEITRIRPDKHLVDLATRCYRENGEELATGRALVYVRDVVRNTAAGGA